MASSFEQALRDLAKRQARVKADPLIGVDSVVKPLQNFMKAKESQDLYTLLLAGQPTHNLVKFRSTPNPEAICKVGSLLWELLDVCPNTKLKSSVLQGALKYLVGGGEIRMHTKIRWKSQQEFFDVIDTMIRVYLSWLRDLKNKSDWRARSLRRYAAADQAKLKLLLTRVEAKSGEASDDDDEEAEDIAKRLPAPQSWESPPVAESPPAAATQPAAAAAPAVQELSIVQATTPPRQQRIAVTPKDTESAEPTPPLPVQ